MNKSDWELCTFILIYVLPKKAILDVIKILHFHFIVHSHSIVKYESCYIMLFNIDIQMSLFFAITFLYIFNGMWRMQPFRKILKCFYE